MSKSQYLLMVCLISLWFCPISQAQGLKDRLRGKIKGTSSESGGGERENQLVDFEGVVWEYKIMDRTERNKSKKTRMVGRIRVKQAAVFAVGGVDVLKSEPDLTEREQAVGLIKKFDRDGNQQLNEKELTKLLISLAENQSSVTASEEGKKVNRGSSEANRSANGLQGELKGLLSQRINSEKEKEQGAGSERIGDLSKKTSTECLFIFDQDDSYPLSGRAELQPDTNNKGGVWFGYYDEYVDGKKRHRWRIEMRKIDE